MKRVISTDKAPAAVGPYSQAIEVNGVLYVSGQIPLDPETKKLIEGGIEEQTIRVLKNIDAIIEAAGYTIENIVKTTCLLTDINNFQTMNNIYSKIFKEDPPARATYEVSNLPLGVLVEIECVAVKDV